MSLVRNLLTLCIAAWMAAGPLPMVAHHVIHHSAEEEQACEGIAGCCCSHAVDQRSGNHLTASLQAEHGDCWTCYQLGQNSQAPEITEILDCRPFIMRAVSLRVNPLPEEYLAISAPRGPPFC